MFLRGVVVDGDIKNIANPFKDQLSEKDWKFILNLENQRKNLDGIPEKIEANKDVWQTWLTSDEPTELPLPNQLDQKISNF
jgi:hypothetical protein